MQISATGLRTTQANRRGAFSLIEILAVVLILGLLMSLLLPAIGAGGGRRLRQEGDRIAASLELARQRAIVTGKPHRVILDLEKGGFTIEWLVSEARAFEGEEDDSIVEEAEEIDTSPPTQDVLGYYPIPSATFGAWEFLEEGYFFEGIDTAEGWIESGEVYIVFDWDGATDASQIVISDPDNRSLDLDIAPLLETVRMHEETD